MMKENTRIFVKNMVGSSFGLGFSPLLPGSFGTLPAVILHFIFISFISINLTNQLLFLIVYLVIVSFIHYKLTKWAVQYYNDNDPSQFVLDEIAGYLFTEILFILLLMFFKPDFFNTNDFTLNKMMIWGFVLFRVLDMIKIPPAWQVDKRMHNATGILLDDIISGTYAAVLLFFMFKYGII